MPAPVTINPPSEVSIVGPGQGVPEGHLLIRGNFTLEPKYQLYLVAMEVQQSSTGARGHAAGSNPWSNSNMADFFVPTGNASPWAPGPAIVRIFVTCLNINTGLFPDGRGLESVPVAEFAVDITGT